MQCHSVPFSVIYYYEHELGFYIKNFSDDFVRSNIPANMIYNSLSHDNIVIKNRNSHMIHNVFQHDVVKPDVTLVKAC